MRLDVEVGGGRRGGRTPARLPGLVLAALVAVGTGCAGQTAGRAGPASGIAAAVAAAQESRGTPVPGSASARGPAAPRHRAQMAPPRDPDARGGAAPQSVPEPEPIPAGRAAPEGRYGALDVLRYDAEIGLPGPGGRAIEGRATLTLRPTREGVDSAVLDFTGLAVLEVRVQGRAVTAAHHDGLLTVPLPAGVTAADTLAVEIRYRGVPDDGLILRETVRGRPAAFVDNWPNRTRFWLPSVDHPSDKAMASLTILAPEGWEVVSNGVLAGEAEAATPAPDGTPRLAWRWETRAPLSPYNLVFGAAELEVIPLGVAACGSAPLSPRPDGCVEVSAWLYPQDTAQASLSFQRAPKMVDFYTELVGPYPFAKLAHVQSATRFGGMENASAIFYSERALASGRSIEGTVAHETAHQWFGDHVTQEDWSELWLSEGFATYFGNLFFEGDEGGARFRALMEEDRRQVLASPDVARPVIDAAEQDLFALLNANNYQKGGWVLHMLRGMLGDEAFFQGIRAYYRRFAGGNATTEEFRAVMEEASGRELGWFFQQWLEEPGFPRLASGWEWDAEAGEVVLTVRQEPRPGWPVYRIPMEVAVASRGETTRHRIEITGREERFRLPARGPVRDVALDPDGWVLWEDVG